MKKKPLFVATMYDKYFFIMYTDKKGLKEDSNSENKEKNE